MVAFQNIAKFETEKVSSNLRILRGWIEDKMTSKTH